MTFIHIATSPGSTIEMVQAVEQKVGPREAIDGLLIETDGTDGNVLRHVSVWESQAHKDRYEAQQLLPVFESLGVASDVAANTQFATCEAADLCVRQGWIPSTNVSGWPVTPAIPGQYVTTTHISPVAQTFRAQATRHPRVGMINVCVHGRG